MARGTLTRTTCANSYCCTTRERTARTTATTAAANATGSCRSTTAAATATAPSTPPKSATTTAAAKYAAPARLYIQSTEFGAEYVVACCPTYASSPKHAPSSTTAATFTTFTATATAAAIRRRRKTEQKGSLGNTEPDVRQSRLQLTTASLPGRLCRPKFGIWTSSGRSLVEYVGRMGYPDGKVRAAYNANMDQESFLGSDCHLATEFLWKECFYLSRFRRRVGYPCLI